MRRASDAEVVAVDHVLMGMHEHDLPLRPDQAHRSGPEAKKPQQRVSLGDIPAEHRLLTTAEAAAYFQVTERTVEAWRAKRLLPYRKIGRTIRYRFGDLLQALDERFLVSRQ